MLYLLKALSKLPLAVLYTICDVIFFISYHIFQYRVKVVEENLRKSFPEMSEKERKKIKYKFYRNFATLTAEIIKSISISREEVLKRVKAVNVELPVSYMNKGQSTVVLTGHQGNWELLLLACSIHSPFPIDAVYKPLSISWANDLMFGLRSKFGARPIAMKETMRDLVKRKNVVRTIAMVADQTPSGGETQHWTNFFHQDTSFFVGGEKIASMMNAPLIFLEMKRIKRGYYEMTFRLVQEPPFVSDKEHYPATDKYVALLEESIRRQPEDWLWSHRRWKYSR